MRSFRIEPDPRLTSSVRELGRYALIELLLPGGSLIALAVWAIRHRAAIGERAPHLFWILAVAIIGLALPGCIGA
jgi:hypothetical protein